MNTKNIFRVGTAVLVSAFLTSPGFAMDKQDWGGGAERHGKFEEKMHKRMDKTLTEIGVSEDQIKKIKEQRSVNKEAREKIFSQLREKREALKQAIEAPETDRARIDALIGEMSGLITEKMKQRVEAELALKGILTPEQYTQLRAKKEEMFKEMKGRKKFGRHHEGPPPDEA